MPLVSTIPGAIQTVAGYMGAVAAAYPEMALGVYAWGVPTGTVSDNYIGLGDLDTGSVVEPTSYDWAAIPADAALVSEAYALQGVIRCSAPAGGPLAAQARTADAYTVWSALLSQVIDDPGGGGNLTPSGSWGPIELTGAFSGPGETAGWMVTLAFKIHVINAQLVG